MTNKEELRDSIKDIENAKLFHDTYESLAPDFGYETRLDTKQFDPFSDNGRLMIETCRLVVQQIRKSDTERVVREIEKIKKPLKCFDEDCPFCLRGLSRKCNEIQHIEELNNVVEEVLSIIKQHE